MHCDSPFSDCELSMVIYFKERVKIGLTVLVRNLTNTIEPGDQGYVEKLFC